MKTYEIIIDEGTRYEVVLNVVECGKDLNVSLCGGTRHHIGAVALGYPSGIVGKETLRSATVSVICINGHKDDEIARKAAKYLATEMNSNVSVVAGVHINDANAYEIKTLVDNCMLACNKFINIRK